MTMKIIYYIVKESSFRNENLTKTRFKEERYEGIPKTENNV